MRRDFSALVSCVDEDVGMVVMLLTPHSR
jgi:hypothetical protein